MHPMTGIRKQRGLPLVGDKTKRGLDTQLFAVFGFEMPLRHLPRNFLAFELCLKFPKTKGTN
jgi:hypothetical protein